MPDRHSRELLQLRRALETMPERPRAVFDLHRFEDRTFAEIAAELNIDIKEVERALADAMVHLAQETDASDPGMIARLWAWLRGAFTRVWRR